MVDVSHRTLKILAAIVWYAGVLILFIKGSELTRNAQLLKPDGPGLIIAWIIGIAIGLVKTRYIFINSCRKNMARIDLLKKPKIWQFYRIRFFVALFLMISLGSFLSRASQGNYTYLLLVAILDISIGTALLFSSKVFFRQKLFTKVG